MGTLLIDLYKKSYGNQQKQFMDKIQSDVLDQGIKYAQWIRFSTKAQAMIEEKVKQQSKKSHDGQDKDEEDESGVGDEDGKKKKMKQTAGGGNGAIAVNNGYI